MEVTVKEPIVIEVNGVKVEGEITYRSRSDINVKINSSYQFGTGLHIPYFGLAFRDFRGHYGDETAALLLKDLYNLCKYVDENKDVLALCVADLDAVISKLEIDDFHEIKIDLRKQLKNGLDLKVYQKLLTQAKKKSDERYFKIQKLEWDLFKETLPRISLSLGDQVLEILRKENNKE
jgi:hypothetical protein